jgi:putative transposase
VRFFNLHYQSPDLQKHRRNVGDCQVEIIVDEDDLGCISIKIGDGYLTVPCMRSGFHGVCLEVWRATCRDLGRRFGREAIIDEPIVRETLAGIQEMIDAGIKRADIGSTTLTAEELDRTERSLSISLSSTHHHHETEIPAHKGLLSDVIPAALARAPTPSPLQPSKISPTWDLTD